VIDVAAATHASRLGTGNSCHRQRDAAGVSCESEALQESDAGAETVDPYVRVQAVGSSAGLQRECSSSIWGEEGTVQANQCGCQAAAVPSQSSATCTGNSRLATLLPSK
jgi:hypothetical protein